MTRFWRFGEREVEYLRDVFESGMKGVYNQRFEDAFATRFGVRFAVGVNSGTSALHAALAALGVGPGDEVIVPPLTFAAPAIAACMLGGLPVFADVDPQTWTLSPQSVEASVTDRTRAVVSVALYGLPPDLPRLQQLLQARGVPLVEDNAQCFLGSVSGRLAGTFGDVSIFSFERSKHMTTGNGGVLITNSEEVASRARRFAVLGYASVAAKQGSYKVSLDVVQHPTFARHAMLGLNYRLPELCAAMALAQLERLDDYVERRRSVARVYGEAASTVNWLRPQHTPPAYAHSYWAYAMSLDPGAAPCTWETFRKEYRNRGGEPYYAAWRLNYKEPALEALGVGGYPLYRNDGCPVAEALQPTLIQLKTNFEDLDTAERQAEVLAATARAVERAGA